MADRTAMINDVMGYKPKKKKKKGNIEADRIKYIETQGKGNDGSTDSINKKNPGMRPGRRSGTPRSELVSQALQNAKNVPEGGNRQFASTGRYSPDTGKPTRENKRKRKLVGMFTGDGGRQRS